LRKFIIDISKTSCIDNKNVVRLSLCSFNGKDSISWLYTDEPIEQVLQNKEYYQRKLIEQIVNNIKWEEN